MKRSIRQRGTGNTLHPWWREVCVPISYRPNPKTPRRLWDGQKLAKSEIWPWKMTFWPSRWPQMMLKMTPSNSPYSKKSYMDPEIVSLSLQEVTIAQELPKFRNLTLKYDILTFRMTSVAVENNIIELAVLKNPYIHPEIISLSLLEVNRAQDSS